MKNTIKSICALLLITTSHFASAGLMNVSKIVITPSDLNAQGWLQVSEVIATETTIGDDLALLSQGATATGSSNWVRSNAEFAIDGTAPASFPNMFHSNENDGSSFLNILLATPSELDSISLFGRTDCCSFRDVYDIALFNVSGEMIFQANDLDATGPEHMVSITLPNSAVPAPASMMLMGLCLLGFASYRKKNG